jgi:hypothetical protein
VQALEKSWNKAGAGGGRQPKRTPALLAALAHRGAPHDVERWVHWLRLGRENGGSAVEMSLHGEATMRALRSKRTMRDSRLCALLRGLEPETVAVIRALGDAEGRERVDRYRAVLSKIRSAVSGDDLLALGLTASPAFSGILSQALADRLDGRAVGRDAELANLRRLVARAGLAAS